MIKLTVRQNLPKPLPGKRIDIDFEKETFTQFKQKCSDLLGMKAELVFNIYGQKINMAADIHNNNVYYISSVNSRLQLLVGRAVLIDYPLTDCSQAEKGNILD